MTRPLRSSDLEAYLDEALPPAEMARIEQALRQQPELLRELAAIHARRDAGVHGLGEIWRQHRLSCPSREQLGSYLLGVLGADAADFLEFHLQITGCRYCQANLADLRAQQAQQAAQVQQRRRRYFQTSAGYLKK
jgi:anti-sigma factor RsiW